MALRILTEKGKDTFTQPTCGTCKQLAPHIGQGSTVWVRPNSETDRRTGWGSDHELFGKVEVLADEAFLEKETGGASDGRTHLIIYTALVYDKDTSYVPGRFAHDFFLTY